MLNSRDQVRSILFAGNSALDIHILRRFLLALTIAILVIAGLLLDRLFVLLRLPSLIGLLVLGVVMGPYALNAIDPGMQAVAGDWRLIALVVILLQAGLEISREALMRVGRRAFLISFIPCLCEVGAVTLVAPHLLGLTYLESAILGSILAAVSPAVVVPLMIKFIKEKRGEAKSIPTLVLAGASCDDAVAIVLCSSFIGLYVGDSVSIAGQLLSVPVSILTGTIAGFGLGLAICYLFSRFNPRATKRVLVVMSIALLLLHVEDHVEKFIPFSAILATMATGFFILERQAHSAKELSVRFGKIWIFAKILLFAIIGSQVNLPVAWKAGAMGIVVIFSGLAGRSIGVQLCLLGSKLNGKERLFVTLSYLPKATVQAAIGAAPLAAMQAAGMPIFPGELILAVAVMSILLTAPLGSALISWGGPNLLESPEAEQSLRNSQATAA